jgi:hypothetical protein
MTIYVVGVTIYSKEGTLIDSRLCSSYFENERDAYNYVERVKFEVRNDTKKKYKFQVYPMQKA